MENARRFVYHCRPMTRYKQSSKAVNGYVLSRGAELKTDPVRSTPSWNAYWMHAMLLCQPHTVVGKYYPLHGIDFPSRWTMKIDYWHLYTRVAKNLVTYPLTFIRGIYLHWSKRWAIWIVKDQMRLDDWHELLLEFCKYIAIMKRNILTALWVALRARHRVLSSVIPHLSKFYYGNSYFAEFPCAAEIISALT